jgi:hypothetical protein
VTPLDRTVLAGLHLRAKKSPLVPGNEGAGVVMEDPSGRFFAGERVLFFAGAGGVTATSPPLTWSTPSTAGWPTTPWAGSSRPCSGLTS